MRVGMRSRELLRRLWREEGGEGVGVEEVTRLVEVRRVVIEEIRERGRGWKRSVNHIDLVLVSVFS